MTIGRIGGTLVLIGCLLGGCSGVQNTVEPDVVDVVLPVPADALRIVVVQVLTEAGYEVDQPDERRLTTGYQDKMAGPWNWLLRWRFGTGKTRVEATVTPEPNENARLMLEVTHMGKDGLFTAWEPSESPLPQSAENQLRLIRNRLQLL